MQVNIFYYLFEYFMMNQLLIAKCLLIMVVSCSGQQRAPPGVNPHQYQGQVSIQLYPSLTLHDLISIVFNDNILKLILFH